MYLPGGVNVRNGYQRHWEIAVTLAGAPRIVSGLLSCVGQDPQIRFRSFILVLYARREQLPRMVNAFELGVDRHDSLKL